ncbi:aspartate/glutamate racemase family protein [Chelatococcus asaccharovorans]|uniref:aspartate/glutamate racemase family protein n=1 Tax=Chelatococcus asaccharovorans TaxID=28210 RepID=UPI002264595A|nr:aspartate/glutamate racemase family protein [Chelatococcus asaccharovorans]
MTTSSPRAPRPRPVHGTTVGIIVLDTRFHRLPGDVANAETWPFPVQFRVVRGVRPQDVIAGNPADALARFYEAIDDLVGTGVAGITTSCGFLAAVHPELRRYSPVPIATSSLMQIPLALSLLPEAQTVGIIVSDKAALKDAHFRNSGAPLGLPMGELPFDGPIRSHMRNNAPLADHAAQEREVLEVVERMLTETPTIGAIVSECANLPPFSAAIRQTFGLPVYDIVSLVEWMYAGLKPRRFDDATRAR